MHTAILKKTISYLSILSVLSYLSFCQPAKAEEPTLPTFDEQATALTIAPSIFEAVVAPGKTTSQIFEIKNGSNFPLPIKCYLRTFDASDEVGGVTISDEIDAKHFSPTTWSQIVEPDFVLQPQSIRKVTVNFSPPIDLPPGGYYGILFAEPLLPESFLSASSLQIGGRLGSLLFLIGPGDTTEKAKLASFNLKKILWQRQSEAEVRIKNLGNVHTRSAGKLIITNIISKKSWEISVPEMTILPGKIRQQKIAISGLKWPGIYQAKLQLTYGGDKIPIENTLTFYYLPLLEIIVIIVIAGIVVSIIWHKPRRRIIRAFRVIIRGES